MAVALYFFMMGCVVLVGFGILALTFRQWYLESKSRKGKA